MTRRLPGFLLLWCLSWLLLMPAGSAQAAELSAEALGKAAAVLQLPGLADDDEDFAPPQDIYARPQHRDDLSGHGGDPVGPLLVCAPACTGVKLFSGTERLASGTTGFHHGRTLHPRAPPAV